MSRLNYYRVHKNKTPRLKRKSKLYYKCFYSNLENKYFDIKKYRDTLRIEAKELAKKHVDVKPIKYLTK